MNEIIVPGEKVASSPSSSQGTYTDHGSSFASVVSLYRDGKAIPLKGLYIPQPGDFVVAVVTVERFSGYILDIHSPYEASLSSRESREQFKVGEVITAKVAEVNEVHEAVLIEPQKLSSGRLIDVSFVKVPRVIGRNGSMLELIKTYTGTDLLVGKNGRIYLVGGNIGLASQALMKIDAEAHQPGLTDRVSAFLAEQAEGVGGGARE